MGIVTVAVNRNSSTKLLGSYREVARLLRKKEKNVLRWTKFRDVRYIQIIVKEKMLKGYGETEKRGTSARENITPNPQK